MKIADGYNDTLSTKVTDKYNDTLSPKCTINENNIDINIRTIILKNTMLSIIFMFYEFNGIHLN